MRKESLALLLAGSLLASCASRSDEVPGDAQNLVFAGYRELPDPAGMDEAAWSELESPLYAAVGSIDRRYPKSQPPAGLLPEWKGSAWKGEKVHLQLVVWARDSVPGLRVSAGELKGEGASIPTEARFVRYVMTDEFAGGCGARKPADFDSSLVADVLDVIPSMDIPARSVRPVWVSLTVPADAPAGRYRGAIRIDHNGKTELPPIPVELEVKDHVLPPPSEWSFHLDLWQNPFAESRVHQVANWSDEHFQAMKPSMELLASAGQKIITASIIHDPWNSQTYDVYESMVRWTKKKDGSWEYDYTVFDKWVEYMSSLGIDRQINCYSMVPWNLKFYYFDETLGRDTLIVAKPGSPEYEAHWKPMLTDFAAHLKEKGWFEKTTIAMDERPLEAMQAVIQLVKSVDPGFKIALAGNYHPEIALDIYDYCIASGQKMGADTLQLRRDQGLVSTYYTCCVEAYPNTFTFSDPAESTWLAWHSAAMDYDGYLRWAYNCWVKDPLRDSRFRAWPAGDTYLVYPGARSSIRFERLIDGIEDFVKISLLRERLREKGDTEGLARLESMLAPFRNIPGLAEVPASEMLAKAYQVLNQF